MISKSGLEVHIKNTDFRTNVQTQVLVRGMAPYFSHDPLIPRDMGAANPRMRVGLPCVHLLLLTGLLSLLCPPSEDS